MLTIRTMTVRMNHSLSLIHSEKDVPCQIFFTVQVLLEKGGFSSSIFTESITMRVVFGVFILMSIMVTGMRTFTA